MRSQCIFFQERCWVVVTGCQENESCSNFFYFLERFDDKIRCTHKETVAVVKPCEDIGSNKSLGCVFSEKPADWTTAHTFEINSLRDFYDVLLHGQFGVKNESKVPDWIRKGDVVRAKSNWIREGNGIRFQGRWKGKEKSFCFVVIQFELIFGHPCFMSSVHAHTHKTLSEYKAQLWRQAKCDGHIRQTQRKVPLCHKCCAMESGNVSWICCSQNDEPIGTACMASFSEDKHHSCW